MLIGRAGETRILLNAAEREQSQLIAVYGRFRVGKTVFVREAFQGHFTFQHTGANQENRKTQLHLFYQSLLDAGLPSEQAEPQSWIEAFGLLESIIQNSTEKKKVIFIDELSWMDTPKSDFIPALAYFWNAWASARKDAIMILCSSATQWMINKVIHNTGGLYNRLTAKIHLAPFTLSQCRAYCEARHFALSDLQILELYMVLGGIPHYWEQLQIGFSVPQNIDHLFFQKDAPLKAEYDHLFASIFRNPAPYEKIIMSLAGQKNGMSRDELLAQTGLTGSGTVTRYLEELESCEFIRAYRGFGKKSKDSLFQLIDPFVLFYHHFIANHPKAPNDWVSQMNTPAMGTWTGLAFEQVCLLHTEQIRIALGIQGVVTDLSSFTCKADPEKGTIGSQIDLVLQRADHVINILEMRYCQGLYTISEKMDESLRHKRSDFRQVTHTRDAIHITVVTPYGLTQNSYAGNVQSVITAEALFRDAN
ncbi:MAG: ATP-binding protein [Lachnospiraceae bacterium]|nr:ATP-binding protein [Lachnospiraceae bacterium]